MGKTRDVEPGDTLTIYELGKQRGAAGGISGQRIPQLVLPDRPLEAQAGSVFPAEVRPLRDDEDALQIGRELLARPEPYAHLVAAQILGSRGPGVAPAAPELAKLLREEPWDSEESWEIHHAALNALLAIGAVQLASFDDRLLRFLSACDERRRCRVFVQTRPGRHETDDFDIFVIDGGYLGSLSITCTILAFLKFNILKLNSSDDQDGWSIKSCRVTSEARGRAVERVAQELDIRLETAHGHLQQHGDLLRALKEATASHPKGSPSSGESRSNALDKHDTSIYDNTMIEHGASDKVGPHEDGGMAEIEWEELGTFLRNQACRDASQLAQHVGQWVAWSPDGSKVVAYADDLATLDERVIQAHEDPRRCVAERIPTEESIIIGPEP